MSVQVNSMLPAQSFTAVNHATAALDVPDLPPVSSLLGSARPPTASATASSTPQRHASPPAAPASMAASSRMQTPPLGRSDSISDVAAASAAAANGAPPTHASSVASMSLADDRGMSTAGGSRRPGNLWTAEAREDMFRRREAGETWETICLDYPNRSRHAMQQQYSMMKKQRALADGTWTSNRRGRKRKLPSPDKWAAGVRRSDRWGNEDELTEDEDYGDLESEDSGEVADAAAGGAGTPYGDPASRPSPLLRSVTDPAPRVVRSRTSLSAAAMDSQDGQLLHPNHARALQAEEALEAAAQKRRKISSPDQQSELDAALPALMNGPGVLFDPPSLMFERDEIIDLITRGERRAEKLRQDYEAEQMARRRTFEASNARATRRLHEAQERVRWLTFENGETKKEHERELNQAAKAHARDLHSYRQDYERDLTQREAVHSQNLDALARRAKLLGHEVEVLQQEKSDVARQAEKDLLAARRQMQNGSDSSEATRELDEAIARADAAATAVAPTSRPLVDNAVEHQVASATAAQLHCDSIIDAAVREFETLSNAIAALHNGVDDMSNKRILQAVNEIQVQNASARARMSAATHAIQGARTTVRGLFAELQARSNLPGVSSARAASVGSPTNGTTPAIAVPSISATTEGLSSGLAAPRTATRSTSPAEKLDILAAVANNNTPSVTGADLEGQTSRAGSVSLADPPSREVAPAENATAEPSPTLVESTGETEDGKAEGKAENKTTASVKDEEMRDAEA